MDVLKSSASLLDFDKLSMLVIGNSMLSIVIIFSLKSKIIPNSFMVLVPMMRSKTGFPEDFMSYSTMSGVIKTALFSL